MSKSEYMYKPIKPEYRVLVMEYTDHIDGYAVISDRRTKLYQEALRICEHNVLHAEPGPCAFQLVTMFDKYGVILYQKTVRRELVNG